MLSFNNFSLLYGCTKKKQKKNKRTERKKFFVINPNKYDYNNGRCVFVCIVQLFLRTREVIDV